MRFIHDLQKVTLDATGGPNDTVVLTMARQDRAFRELSAWIIPGSGRVVGDAAGVRDYTYQFFFGATAVSAAVARSDDEVVLALDPGDSQRIFPANEPTSNLHRSARDRVRGFDISVQLINLDADPIVLSVEFVAMTIDQG